MEGEGLARVQPLEEDGVGVLGVGHIGVGVADALQYLRELLVRAEEQRELGARGGSQHLKFGVAEHGRVDVFHSLRELVRLFPYLLRDAEVDDALEA